VVGGPVERDLQCRIEHHGAQQLPEAAVQMPADGGDLALQQNWVRQLTPVHREHPEPQLHLPDALLIRSPGQLAEPVALQGLRLAALAGSPLLKGQGAATLGREGLGREALGRELHQGASAGSVNLLEQGG
jgi:hypothetical protein